VVVADGLRATIGALPEAALLLSGTGQVLVANPAARDALSLVAATDRNLAELVSDDPERVASMLRTWRRTTEPLPGSFSVAQRSQTFTYGCKGCTIAAATDTEPALVFVRFWLRGQDNPFLLLNQKIAELNEEISRRRQVEEGLRGKEAILRDRAAEAEALNRSKDEFLATLSHELRTPLNAVLGWARLLREGQLDENQRRKGIETIERSAHAQAQLIEEMLDVSRIVTGKLLLNVQHIDVLQVVEAALQAIRPAAEAKEIDLHAVLEPQLGAVMADADRLQQVCWNLLSNAVKFTPRRGSVHVLLGAVASAIELTVADNGRGIRADFLPYVFDRFRQQDPSTTRSSGGLGLGLSIVRSLVELHGGTVRAMSPGEGRGTSFVVRIPRVAAPVVARPVIPAPSLPGPSQAAGLVGLRLVVVDDDPDALELMTSLLEHAGAQVTAASSAAGAFEAVQSARPHVLVSDIGMPGEDGYSLMRRVRLLPVEAGGSTPAVAVTAFARAEDRARALECGFQAHVPKPVDTSRLLAVIANVAGR